ncbi:phosphopantetheine-binding protein [Streptomyces sp. NPDC047046]|uniref:acyl carrier protein n=1 Tax=unclassified Streptomyces TaxID=2593676 RepID=UPI00340C32B8
MSDDLRTTLSRIIVDDLEVEPERVAPGTALAELDLDSLAFAELVVRIKEETGVDLSAEESSMGSLTLEGVAELVETALRGEPAA